MTNQASTKRSFSTIGLVVHAILVLLGAVGLTATFFLVLPLMQAITKPPDQSMVVRDVDVVMPPPPPPPPEEEEPEEEEENPDPPELSEEPPPLNLSQLELALNQGMGGGWGAADFSVNLDKAISKGGDAGGGLFSVSDLDQKPRVMYQASPSMTDRIRDAAPGKVVVIFIVDERGRVQNPKIQRSDNPVFNQAALSAVKQWRFEPGKRGGEPVRFRMRVPIKFPKP